MGCQILLKQTRNNAQNTNLLYNLRIKFDKPLSNVAAKIKVPLDRARCKESENAIGCQIVSEQTE
ncbi:hypothetical protein KIN20_016620 [Parelaphostrongylus tenuis]|uniref:Uncharacterized protein n=1 Tax=Parelaphostrongylus tenuis TaxID=148309 RepID=A0AAD5QQT9_PARTN|nr:hypothetical protein KIN20_016620 [Parelaphostrongylus tenuis]